MSMKEWLYMPQSSGTKASQSDEILRYTQDSPSFWKASYFSADNEVDVF